MPYVQRTNGIINGVYAQLQEGYAEEFLEADNPDVVAYLNPGSPLAMSVSARQFKLQLLAAGIIDQVDTWVAAQPRAVQIAFEYSGFFVRNEPMMAAGFKAMNFNDAQIGAFFEAASKL